MIDIKPANLSHVKALAVLFDAYRVFYRKKTDINGAEAFLSARIQQNESVIFLAYHENTMVGFTQLYPLFSSTNMQRLWLLNDLFVHPDFRGKKIGKALIKKAQEHCIETNAVGVSLETEKTNVPGNQLYPKMKFSLDNEHNYYFWENPSFSYGSE